MRGLWRDGVAVGSGKGECLGRAAILPAVSGGVTAGHPARRPGKGDESDRCKNDGKSAGFGHIQGVEFVKKCGGEVGALGGMGDRTKGDGMEPGDASGGVGGSDGGGESGRGVREGLPRLVVTGERLRRRHLVVVDGERVWLPPGIFALVCRLVRARCTTRTGFSAESPLNVYRLRAYLLNASRALDGMVETGDGEEYRLAPSAEELSASEDVAELAVPELISDEEREVLVRLSYAGRSEISLKSE